MVQATQRLFDSWNQVFFAKTFDYDKKMNQKLHKQKWLLECDCAMPITTCYMKKGDIGSSERVGCNDK